MDCFEKMKLWTHWNNALQIGSLVHFGVTNFGKNILVLEVIRFTKTQVVCGLNGKEERRFMRSSGAIVGGFRYGRAAPGNPDHPLYPKWGDMPIWVPSESRPAATSAADRPAPQDAQDTIPELRNMMGAHMLGEFVVQVEFRSCRSAKAFKQAIDAAMQAEGRTE